MWIAIGVIALSVIMVVGPIMMAKPTPGQRALLEIRTKAQEMGMRIRMVPNPTGADPKHLACYNLPMEEPQANKKPVGWSLTRKGFEHEMHFAGVWQWGTEGAPISCNLEELAEILAGLPDSVVAVSKNKLGASVTWSEKKQGRPLLELLTELKEALAKMNALL